VVKFKIGYLSTIYHTSFILKSKENIFLDGIAQDLEWTLYPTGPAMMDAYRTGTIELGYIGLPPVIIGNDKGLNLKCVAGGHVEGTLMISSDSFKSFSELGNVKDVLKQFEGGSIGTPASGCIHDVIIRNLIQDLDISVINYPWADFIPDAITSGEIQAGVGTPSLVTVAGRQFQSKITIPPHELWPYNPSYGIVVQDSLIKRDPNFIKVFLKAHEAACNFIREEPQKAAPIAAAELGNIDVEFVLDTYKISPKYCASLPSHYIASTLNFIPVLKSLGYLKNDLTAEDIFHLKFIQEVHPGPSHYDLLHDYQSLEK
jgi:NitT/TauT family transport system substrate-binding protein